MTADQLVRDRQSLGDRIVTGELQGWQFRLDVISAGLRVSASAPGDGDPAMWVIALRAT